MSRPTIKEIKVTLEVDGNQKEIFIDPNNAEAIFFKDRSVKWLGAFYDIYGNGKLFEQEAQKAFGTTKTAGLLGGAPEIPLTSGIVDKIWNTPNDTGVLPAMIIKLPNCTLE